jgi:superfamily II DNA/RNA helicase
MCGEELGVKAPALIFVQSRERAHELYRELSFEGINVNYISADRSIAEVRTRFCRPVVEWKPIIGMGGV